MALTTSSARTGLTPAQKAEILALVAHAKFGGWR